MLHSSPRTGCNVVELPSVRALRDYLSQWVFHFKLLSNYMQFLHTHPIIIGRVG